MAFAASLSDLWVALRNLRARGVGVLLTCFAVLAALTGCASSELLDPKPTLRERLFTGSLNRQPVDETRRKASSVTLSSREGGGQKFAGTIRPGNDQLIGQPGSGLTDAFAGNDEEITLNLVDVPIANAAKTILSDILKTSYSIDGRVEGTVTLQTTRPMRKSAVIATFESVLRANGAAIVRQGEF